jgi:hypothetical protein
MQNLLDKIGSQIELDELYKAVEDSIGWRAKEEEAMKSLFDEHPSAHLRDECLRVKLGITKTDEGEVGKWLYKIRNSLVHHRPALSLQNYTDEEWNDLLVCLIIATKDAFQNSQPSLQ